MTLTGLLLTGGRSHRMGRDKATLDIGQEVLWAKQLRLLRELRPQAIWISAREVPVWAPVGVEAVLDLPPSRGPLSGIGAALNRLQTSHLLALAIDLPRMTSEHLRKLASLAQPGCGVIPVDYDHFQPLAALYPKEAVIAAANALASGDVSLHRFAEELFRQKLARKYEIAKEERTLYLNFNEPGDLTAEI